MPLLRLTDVNMQPVVLNTDKVLFVGPGGNGGLAVVLDMPTQNGPMAIAVGNTLEQILERWQAALDHQPFDPIGTPAQNGKHAQ